MMCNPQGPTNYWDTYINGLDDFSDALSGTVEEFLKFQKASEQKLMKPVININHWIENTVQLTGQYRSGRVIKEAIQYKIGFKRKHPELFFDVSEAIIVKS